MRFKASAIALGIATTLVLAGCSSSGGDEPESTGAASEGQGTAALTIAKPDGAIATESNNPWIGDSSALKLGYVNAIYEPVGIVNLVNPSDEVRPWLASEIAWSDDYTSVALTAREGVKFNDGSDMTAEDIAYSYQILVDTPALDTAAIGVKSVETEGDVVTVTFNTPMFAKQDKALHRFVVPKAVWEGIADPTTETNPEPIGTGPYTLSNFSTESVELTARDDYWGGELAVPTLYYVSYNDNNALTTALANGDADWAQAFLPNVQSAYVDKDPEHNIYWAPAGLGTDMMFVNTTKKPFDDVAFRKAVNMVIDRTQHQEIAREGGVPVLTSVTGLPTPAGDAYISEEYVGKDFTVDVDGAKQVLTDAGYTYEGDKLIDPEGDPVTFTLSVPQGWNDYVTGISLISDSVKAIGVEAAVDTPDQDSWWAARQNGDFDAVLNWTDTGATPWDLYSDTMDGRWLKPIGEPADFNFGRFDSPEATAALDSYIAATDDEARAEAIATAQKIFVEEVPAMPIGTRPFITEFNSRNYVGWPSDEDPYINADPTQPSSVLILTELKPAG
ncbi:ABC transporter substrate-binding protein [Cellulosimicrobium terreum]|nr:ABC transporter substrate-binding protein [Cellulosimicrobium terreum]